MDPLRPFTDLVRSLSSAGRGAASRTDSGTRARSVGQEPPAATGTGAATDDLRTRLRARLLETGLADVRRAREVFVEVVLARELSEQLAGDHRFIAVVRAVADRIAERPQMSARLHEILVELSAPV